MLFHDINRQCDLELMKKVANSINKNCYVLEDDFRTGFINI